MRTIPWVRSSLVVIASALTPSQKLGQPVPESNLVSELNSGVLEKLGVGGPSWEEQERERYRVNLVPVENQHTSEQRQEREQRRLQASEAARIEADAELEYVELEDRRQESMQQRRYLDEPQRYDEQRYAEPARYDERPAERAQTYNEPAPFDQQPAYEEQPPRRAMPASRRAVQQSSEPLDVEPMQDAEPQLRNQDLDDPW